MRVCVFIVLALHSCSFLTFADVTSQARSLEQKGDFAGARQLLQSAANRSVADPSDLVGYAQYLDRYRDPGARVAYEKALRSLNGPQATAAARRLIALDLLAGDREALARHQTLFKSHLGADLALKPNAARKSIIEFGTATIPGPLASFARMAALSPDLSPEDVLPALARNVITNGYQAAAANEALDQTEYLKLLIRYMSQARELEKLAASSNDVIKIDTCDSPQTSDLLRVLGYRMRGGCGSDVVLETVNATRAFLTIDSGFPLAQLEQSLRTNRPFTYNYAATKVPVTHGTEYWTVGREKSGSEFIDIFLSDPSLCRLYLGLSKLDPETSLALKNTMPAARIKAFAHVLDFYGGLFQMRDGAAVLPGGDKTAAAWTELVGKSPKEGAAFFERLVTRDDGWLASYYDAVGRISGPVRDYLTDPKRLQRFYSGMRGKVTSPGPARPVFRASTDLMLLSQRLRLESDGKPHIPGNIEVWKNLFINHPHGKYDGKLTKAATGWKDADDLLEALFALSRKAVENEPLKIYMALSDLNRFRSKPLEPATVDKLAREYRDYGSQYGMFAEAPSVSDKTILLFLDVAAAAADINDHVFRADTGGSLQALTSLWQVMVRQGSIPVADADATLNQILARFAKLENSRQLFDATRDSTKALLAAAKTAPGASAQDRMLDLMAGTGSTEDADSHRQVVEGMIRIYEAQRLVSLDDIFGLSDHLDALTKGEKLNAALVNKFTSRFSEIQLPRSALSGIEKNTLAFGYWTEKHVEQQRRLNLKLAVERAANDPQKIADIKGSLAGILRDTLVGFNYIHYAPPGAQILETNPLFVRSHDFIGLHGSPQLWKATEVFGSGWPSSAGGRLVGSLSALPYALAEAEQNFLIPSREQALIWGDLVPQMLISSKVNRWWNVTPGQLNWVASHMSQAEDLIAQSAFDTAIRAEVLDLLATTAPPARVHRVREAIETGNIPDAVENITPSEMYLIAGDWLAAHSDDKGLFASEIRRLHTEAPEMASYAAVSRAFGTPKPTLTNSYRPEILRIRTFPTLMGYSSRIMAESWESNLLYYAALAHEMNIQPSQLNVYVPEWTQQTVERIFATHLEDWPALLRSLRLVGDQVRTKFREQATTDQRAAAGLQ